MPRNGFTFRKRGGFTGALFKVLTEGWLGGDWWVGSLSVEKRVEVLKDGKHLVMYVCMFVVLYMYSTLEYTTNFNFSRI